MRDVNFKNCWRWVLLAGVVLAVLRIINISYVFHASARDGVNYYIAPDSFSYIENSRAMFDDRPMSPFFRERIVYPFLMAVANKLSLDYKHVLWVTVPLEIPATLCAGLLGWLLARRRAVVWLSVLIYAINPNGFQHSATLVPDWLNMQLILMASTGAIAWAVQGNKRGAWMAGLLFPLSQMVRPTMFPIIGPLGLLLIFSFFRRDRFIINLLVCLSVLVYPAINTVLNHQLYGMTSLLLTKPGALRHGYMSYVRAMQENEKNPGAITELYFFQKHQVMMADPREVALGFYEHKPIPENFAALYHEINHEAEVFLQQHRNLWFKAALAGIRHQFLNPPLLENPDYRNAGLYIGDSGWYRRIHFAALFFAIMGVCFLIRGLPPGVTLFYASMTGLIIMASAMAWYDSGRVRLPLDLLYIPVIAAGFLHKRAWITLAVLALVAYVPRRFLGFSHEYFSLAACIVLAIGGIWIVTRSTFRLRTDNNS